MAKKQRCVCAYVFELEEAEVAEVGDGKARGLGGDDDLHQLHHLRPHKIHGRAPPAAVRHRAWRACSGWLPPCRVSREAVQVVVA